LEKDLIEWVKKVSEKKNELGGFSICPFAKKAMEDNKVFLSYIGFEAESYILRYVESTPDFELIVFYNLIGNLTDEDLKNIITKLQAKRNDLIFLKDHPDNPGIINGVNTSNDKYPVILVQTRKSLERAREKLSETKYYDYWSEEYKNEILNYGKQ
jgi:hypothetical protein